jgi:hypothetical protein
MAGGPGGKVPDPGRGAEIPAGGGSPAPPTTLVAASSLSYLRTGGGRGHFPKPRGGISGAVFPAVPDAGGGCWFCPAGRRESSLSAGRGARPGADCSSGRMSRTDFKSRLRTPLPQVASSRGFECGAPASNRRPRNIVVRAARPSANPPDGGRGARPPNLQMAGGPGLESPVAPGRPIVPGRLVGASVGPGASPVSNSSGRAAAGAPFQRPPGCLLPGGRAWFGPAGGRRPPRRVPKKSGRLPFGASEENYGPPSPDCQPNLQMEGGPGGKVPKPGTTRHFPAGPVGAPADPGRHFRSVSPGGWRPGLLFADRPPSSPGLRPWGGGGRGGGRGREEEEERKREMNRSGRGGIRWLAGEPCCRNQD